jgi:1-acyl-sn-glycerol-3-phosphate acyltransferase
MTKPLKFVPPQPNPTLIWLAHRLAGAYAWGMSRFRLQLDDRDRQRLQALAQSRVVYLPNHPTHGDGIAMFVLSAHLQQAFHYIAAYESFQGWQGPLMARLGAYSIRRGVGDRHSILTTLKLLETPACKLVMFPEGGCSYQNDTVMPFREGAVGLSLKALKNLAKTHETIPDFYLVPISLKYQHQRAMNQAIARSLQRLENALDVPQKSPDFYWRLRTVAGALLRRIEAEFGVVPPPEPQRSDWNYRIDTLKNAMLATYEQRIGLDPHPHLPMRERIYRVQAELEAQNEKLATQSSNAKTGPSSAIPAIDGDTLYRDTLRLLNFDAIYDGYIAENPTQERFLDTLTTMEREVFRVEVPPARGLRIARVKVGTAINLKDYLDEYSRDKDAIVQTLTQTVQTTVQDNVLAMSRQYHPSTFPF